MNTILNDRNETVVAVGAPGSLARVKVERPALIEQLAALFNCGAKIDEAVNTVRKAGISSEMEINSLLKASHYSINPEPVKELVCCATAQPNRAAFVAAYARRMKAHSDKNPGMYIIPESWEVLAERMTDGLIRGSANLSSVAKATLKEFGVKPTYTGAKEFLRPISITFKSNSDDKVGDWGFKNGEEYPK